jgi:hypothetical protein
MGISSTTAISSASYATPGATTMGTTSRSSICTLLSNGNDDIGYDT